MTLPVSLADFKARVAQCDSLMASAHIKAPDGTPLFPQLDSEQITIAAFLNFFIAWESFLEDALTKLMAGALPITGVVPVRFVMPPTQDDARNLVKGNNRYFDYANIEFVRNYIKMFFKDGFPFEPHIAGIVADLFDLKTMRNSSAHLTTSTQRPLDALAQRILTTSTPGISLYTLMTSPNPNAPGKTVYSYYRDKIIAVAELIVKG